MYIRTTTNQAGQEYYHLVESYREGGKIRQRTLMSLGRAGEDRMEDVITAISKHKDVLTILDLAKNISRAYDFYHTQNPRSQSFQNYG